VRLGALYVRKRRIVESCRKDCKGERSIKESVLGRKSKRLGSIKVYRLLALYSEGETRLPN
jgi:hypothetical protein